LQQVTCQRAEPMTGKKGWPLESCARTSEWFHKNHRSVSVRKRLSEAAFKESSVKSSVKAVGNSPVTGNLGQLAFHASSAEINKESTCKIMDPNTECLPSFDTPESSSVDIRETSGERNENVESPVNMYRTSVAFNHNDAQEVKATLNFTPNQKGKNKGAATKRNLSLTVQNGTSTGNKTRIIANHESSVVDQTFSDLKLMKVSNTGNLTKRNKPESGKVESVHSFERKTCTPGELLDSTIVSRRQKKSEETSLVNSKQQLLPVARDAASTAPMKEKAYEDDVLIIDVIQDDPDLFGTTDEEQVAVAGCEDCPLKASFTSICIEEEKQDLKPKYPVISENRDSVDDIFRVYTFAAKDIKTHNSSRGSSPLGGVTEDFLEDGQQKELDELLKSFNVDDKFRFADGVPDVKPQIKDEAQKRYGSVCIYNRIISAKIMIRLDQGVRVTKLKLWTDNYINFQQVFKCHVDCSRNSHLLYTLVSHSVQQILEMMELPRKYCRFYFMTLHGCERGKCWVWHIPQEGDEKVCMTILRTYISTKESRLLKRAVEIFVKYYRRVTPGVHFDSQVMHDLLISLLKNCLLAEVFQILHVTVQINTLPAVDVLLKVFEHVASLNLRDSVPALIDTFCKLIDAGMFLKLEHFDNIIKFLHQLQVSSRELNIVLNIKSRTFQERYFENNWLFDLNLAMAEIQHYKEINDWTMLGAFYVSVRTGCEHFGDLQKLSLCIAEILTRDFESTRPEVPFCDFADAVIKNSQHNGADRDYIGRTGISVMYSYHKVLQWTKGRKVLDILHKLQINFTVLKGLTGVERLASRCDIVNKAADIFLKTGSLDGATWVLTASEWTTNSPLWPCDKVDILNRHKLLCTLANEYLRKSSYKQALEVLQNLPSFHNHSDTVDVSQYSYLFNKLISACFESKNLGIPSSAIDFMLSKNMAIDFFLLRGLITGLGRRSLWSKARTYYKSALSLGCYPQPQGNLYDSVLMILSHMSEVEMLLAIEIFLVSNASVIQSPTAANQTLQIVLKRCGDQSVQNNSDYQAAVERLILAARLPDPKLILKYVTVNVNTDEVFSLELASALKWLQKNMKWAGKVWLFQ
ncbi:TOPZ1 protein, partial [Piaya cayana]|nr:TOPZ1 protein [Piaya cayana]